MTVSVSGFSIIQGLSSALDNVLPSPTMVGIWTHRMGLNLCFQPMFMVWFEAEPILLWLRQDLEVARLAAICLHWVSIGLPVYAFNCILQQYFRLFTVLTRIIMIVPPLSLLLNWLMGIAHWPFIFSLIPTFQIASASTMYDIYLTFFVETEPTWTRRARGIHPVCRQSFQNLGILFHFALSQTASEWISPLALATQSGPFALGITLSVRIGNLLGEGLASHTKITTNASIALSLAFATFTCTLFLLFRNKWVYIFNNDPSVVSLVAAILLLVGQFQFFFDGTAAVTGGILRVRGKQVRQCILHHWAPGIFLTFNPKVMLGLYGLWISLRLSLVYCMFFGMWFCVRTLMDWDEEVCKVWEWLAKERSLIGLVLPDKLENGEETEGE
ncbi:hypothetical protein DFH08DRAFT_915818 [Mycena albidolilacea]|uniref:Uncharacterized protein n=1 Tax=Mycena albidolilacea TaxID=1033008 RepID=A0AAD6ZSZ1_9AGAR|nr:hypothetical protein DFH08DRAFT_915818 [Mycena albidolilacea]